MILTRVYKTTFDSSHCIEGHPQCGEIHGHTYHVTVKVTGSSNVWLDFKTLRDDVNEYVHKLDHKPLGNITAEEICFNIAVYLRDKGYTGQVELFETEKFGVIIGIASTMSQEEIKFAKYK